MSSESEDQFLARFTVVVCSWSLGICALLVLAAIPLRDPIVAAAGLLSAAACGAGIRAARAGWAREAVAVLLVLTSFLAASSSLFTPADPVAGLASTTFTVMLPTFAALTQQRRVAVGIGLFNWVLYCIAFPLAYVVEARPFDALVFEFAMLTVTLAVTTAGVIYFKERDQQVVSELEQGARAVRRLARHAERVADGDLSVRLQRDSELEQVVGSMLEGLRTLVARTAEASADSVRIGEQLTELGKQQEALLKLQLRSLSALGHSTDAATALASDLEAVGGAVSDAATHTLSSIHEVEGRSQALTAHTRRVNSVLRRLKELAGQTDVLAINAQLEAVQAGERGAGFMIIAVRLSKLTTEMTKAAVELADLNRDLDSAAGHMSEAMGRSVGSTKTTFGSVARIQELSAEQLRQSAQVSERVHAMQQATSELHNSQVQLLHTVAQLAELHRGLDRTVAGFRV